MEKKEFKVDLREFSEGDQKEWMEDIRQIYKFNATMPHILKSLTRKHRPCVRFHG